MIQNLIFKCRSLENQVCNMFIFNILQEDHENWMF